MSTKKIVIVVVIVLALAGIAAGTILHGQAGITKVATGKVVREDLVSTVSGTGQIKPKNYVNIGATSFGRITHLYVKEGDRVHKGDILARVESVQPEATVDAQQAAIASSKTDIASYVAAENTAQANITQARADLEQKKFDFDRAQALYNAQLIAKQDFDAKKAAYDVSAATLDQRVAALAQARAQTASPSAPTWTRPSPASAPTSTPSTKPSAAPPSTASSPTSRCARERRSWWASRTPRARP